MTDRVYGDPEELERLARAMRARAGQLHDAAADHQQQAEAMRWVSDAADQARARVRTQRRQLDEAADAVIQAAALLEEHAATVRERQQAIAELERRVTDWFSSTVEAINDAARPRPIWSSWPVTPLTLPPPGDRRWLEVGDFMTRQGVL